MGETILQLFPAGHRAFWSRTAGAQERIQEIRLRAGRPVVLYMDGREIFLTEQGEFSEFGPGVRCMSMKELEEILEEMPVQESMDMKQVQAEVRQEVQKILGKMNLVAEDIKGSKVDAAV